MSSLFQNSSEKDEPLAKKLSPKSMDEFSGRIKLSVRTAQSGNLF